MADEPDDTVVRLSRMEAFQRRRLRHRHHPAGAGAFDTGGVRRASARSSAQPLAVLSGIHRQFATILVLIVIGWFLPLVAVIGYLVIAFILIFPLHLIRPQRSQPAVS
jgi:hypothetical protein